MKVKDFIKNAKELIDHFGIISLDEFEDVFGIQYPNEEIEIVSSRQNSEPHKFYNLATDVFMLEDGFVGVRGGDVIYSVDKDWSDICFKATVDIYEAYPSTAYCKKIVN